MARTIRRRDNDFQVICEYIDDKRGSRLILTKSIRPTVSWSKRKRRPEYKRGHWHVLYGGVNTPDDYLGITTLEYPIARYPMRTNTAHKNFFEMVNAQKFVNFSKIGATTRME